MNKKGFTLIELLSVVTLIVLVSLIVLPNISNNINKKKTELSEANNKLLTAATNTYIEKNPGKYVSTYEADGSIYCIPIQEIINDGVLVTPFKNVNGNEIDYTNVVKATYEAAYNSFDYELVEKSECTEFINYISRPQLFEGMIPVVYEDGAWKKADANTKWYNYTTKNWANAVLVNQITNGNSNSKSRREYIEAAPGTVINEEDILAYFVWIPRFRYKLFNQSTPGDIDIVFESVGTHKSTGTTQDEWLTHPAFTYKNEELSGIWVGKYEASNSNNNIAIKPNQTPWTNIGFNDASNISNIMINENNIYGLNGVNSHLIQNNEWSSVTYLTQSAYGLNNRVETNSATTTGGTNSTTGNNTGIYDMAGLSSEFVTVNEEDENSLGYSLNETKLWYSDTNSFINESNLYLTRGTSSIFNYNASKIMNPNTSFRPVIINTEVSSINQDSSTQYAYLNETSNKQYRTLEEAFAEVNNGDTIKVLDNKADNSSNSPTVTEGKNIVLDLNGKEISLSKRLTNNGTLDIYSSVDNGKISSDLDVIVLNYGTLTINGTSSSHSLSIVDASTTTQSARAIISNYNIATINGNTTLKYVNKSTSGTANRYVVLNYQNAEVTINGATLINNMDNKTTEYGISNSSTATGAKIIFNSGTVETVGNAIINNGSTNGTKENPAIKVTGGSLRSTMGNGISNYTNDSMVYITGGIIEGSRGIYNSKAGKIEISGTPTITGTTYQALRVYNGSVNIEGGTNSGPTLIGNTDGIYLTTADGNSGSAIITGYVSITAETQYGIQAGAGTSVTIGNKSDSVSTTYPYIVSNASGMYGVNISSDATFNFYDGKIKGVPGRAINRNPNDKPDGYSVVKTTEDGMQVATLGAS